MGIVLTEPVVGLVKRIEITDNGNTFLDTIYEASEAQGWNPKFEKNGSSFVCPYEIFVLGDTSFFIGYINPESLSFNIPTGTENYIYAMYCSNKVVRIGRLDSNNRRYNFGGVISMQDTYRRGVYLNPSEILQIHNSMFQLMWYGYFGCLIDGNITNSSFNYIHFGTAIETTIDTKNITITGGYYGLSGAPKTVNGLLVDNTHVGIIYAGYNATFKNVEIGNVISGSGTFLRCGNSGVTPKHLYYIDCKINRSEINFYISGTGTARNNQYLQSTIDINIFDDDGNVMSGVTVSIYDNIDNLIYESVSDVNGKVETILTYFHKWQDVSGGAYVGEGEIDFEPFKVKVTKTGYETYVLDNVTVIEGEKTIIRAQLKKQVPLLIPVGGGSPVLKLNPENYGNDRDLGTILMNNP